MEQLLLNIMPKASKKSKTYSYKNNKNQFKEVLNAMSNTNNVTAFNENNQCISSLGEMWEECDLNICGDRCKERILNAYDMSKQEECKSLVTGMDGERQIRMEADIKTGILDPLGATLTPGKTLYFDLIRNMSKSFKSC